MIYWIWLTQLPFIGPVTARYLIEELKDAENIYKADAGHLAEIPGLSEQQRRSILQNHSLELPKRIFEDCQHKIEILLFWQPSKILFGSSNE